ncbi:CBS domain-containing protein CBSCBSPB2 [Hondaea fermentalgiana]|uniref:CBS domain-containing protein CBSCBSPB2 n=1 Tax=Hondaea fermentalgiana TaxID=2315210 RepID=A0A2R5GE50_9STRA|nr:CBS domain-containing protein CBSCBSPB2 [Hondaea fermentalgiana]|eukprot:GBG26491.1 CBS domain-containing protein CBSCBSPB2 [Hondaea fermentalgiana]
MMGRRSESTTGLTHEDKDRDSDGDEENESLLAKNRNNVLRTGSLSRMGKKLLNKKKTKADKAEADTEARLDAALDVLSHPRIRAKSLVSAAVVVVAQDNDFVGLSAVDAAERLRVQRQSCVIVLNADRTVRGIVTEQDLVRKVVAQKGPAPEDLAAIMTHDPVSLDVDGDRLSEYFERSLELMARQNFRHVPFVDCASCSYVGCVDIVGAIASGKASGLAHTLSFPAGKLVRVLGAVRSEVLAAGNLQSDSAGPEAIDQISADTCVYDAAACMRTQRLTSLLVVDNQGKSLLGILTESDIVRKVLARNADAATMQVSQIMTRRPMTARADINPYEGLRTMIERGFRHLPVQNDAGQVVTTLDILTLVKISFKAHHQPQGHSDDRGNDKVKDSSETLGQTASDGVNSFALAGEKEQEVCLENGKQKQEEEEEEEKEETHVHGLVSDAAMSERNIWNQVLSSNLPADHSSPFGDAADDTLSLDQSSCADENAVDVSFTDPVEVVDDNELTDVSTLISPRKDKEKQSVESASAPAPVTAQRALPRREKEAIEFVLASKFAEAITCLDAAIKEEAEADDVMLARLYTRRGHIKSCTGDLQGAFADLEKGLEYAESCQSTALAGEAASGLCEILIETGRYEAAAARLSSGVLQPTQEQECQSQLLREMQKFKDLGKDLFGARDFSGAVVAYTNALRALQSFQGLQKAKTDAEQEHARTLAILHSNRAACYQSLRDFRYAMQDAKAAIAADEAYGKGWTRLCACRAEKAQWKSCLEEARRGVTLLADCDPSATQQLRGIIQRAEAELQKERMVKLDAIKSLGQVLSAAGLQESSKVVSTDTN